MANLTKAQRDAEEVIKRKIVAAHQRGVCDKDGNPIPPRVYGVGHMRCALVNWGEPHLNVWPRDEQGELLE